MGSVEELVHPELQARKVLQVSEVQDRRVVLVYLDHLEHQVCLEVKELEARLVRIIPTFI